MKAVSDSPASWFLMHRLAGARVDLGEADARQPPAHEPGRDHQQQEQHDGVGEPVADALDDVERAGDPATGGDGGACLGHACVL